MRSACQPLRVVSSSPQNKVWQQNHGTPTFKQRYTYHLARSSAEDVGPSSSGRGSQPDADPSKAWVLLKAFSAAQFKGLSRQYVSTPEARSNLRDALLLVYSCPDAPNGWHPVLQPEVLLGVVASDSRLGIRALRDWCQALHLDFVLPECRVADASSVAGVTGAVYIKYNSASKVCYLSTYKGHDRGVLVQLGQAPMLGHFPLGLFDESMSNPAPALDAAATTEQSS